jgi:ketosteroid isomerase-like protein
MEYLAPDGVVFRPGPVNGLAYFAERPAGTALLSWRPALAGISAAGDLGYSTGPFEVRGTPEGPVTGSGWYLSVWRRQEDGSLRLVADHGLSGSGAPDTTQSILLLPAAPAGSSPMPELAALDTVAGPAPAHDQVRTGARGAMHVGAAARTALLQAGVPALAPLGGGGASSADVGYTYGSYRWGEEQGHYLRVWRQTPVRWVVTAEVFSPAG